MTAVVVSDPGQAHLQRLMASWGMLADLCISDLLLLLPFADESGSRFSVIGQMRPTTGQTLHKEDLVGRLIDEVERPLVGRAWRLGEIVEGESGIGGRGERARVQCIPVRFGGQLLAVLTRESPLSIGRRPGELERIYVQVFDRFARMIVNGEFPFLGEDVTTEESPRVGDGVIVLDQGARVEYASPNAVSALHRMGITTNAEGLRLDELGMEETAVERSFATVLPVNEEIERRNDVVISLRCIPLLDQGRITGALALIRDVSDLRRRDRLLISKDATIREIHHRVKNNLQTISSLLRLRARRLHPGLGRTALDDVEREIRSIAIVHEILSRDAREQVAFEEIIRSLVRMAEDTAHSLGKPVRFRTEGDAGELPADVATPLAVIITELFQNAVEHAFPDDGKPDEDGESPGGDAAGDDRPWRVEAALANNGHWLTVDVRDNGRGLPPGFALESTTSLGLSIVRDLVTTQLGGSIAMYGGKGTHVELRIPAGPGAGDGLG